MKFNFSYLRWYFIFSWFFLSVYSCAALTPRSSNSLTLMTWNIQNLFNDQLEGGEYAEFIPSPQWTTGDFYARCAQVARHVQLAGTPDLLVLQELENFQTAQILQSLFLADLGYLYWYTEDSPGVQCVVLSRHPLLQTSYLQPEGDEMVTQRPILEVLVNWEGRNVRIFANHWKSQREGSSTQKYRSKSNQLLNYRLKNLEDEEIFLVGDFNCDPTELQFPHEFLDAWKSLEDHGTYWFRDAWQKLDQIHYKSQAAYLESWVFRGGDLADSRGRPKAWAARSKKGLSDHFPLLMRLEFLRE